METNQMITREFTMELLNNPKLISQQVSKHLIEYFDDFFCKH